MLEDQSDSHSIDVKILIVCYKLRFYIIGLRVYEQISRIPVRRRESCLFENFFKKLAVTKKYNSN